MCFRIITYTAKIHFDHITPLGLTGITFHRAALFNMSPTEGTACCFCLMSMATLVVASLGHSRPSQDSLG